MVLINWNLLILLVKLIISIHREIVKFIKVIIIRFKAVFINLKTFIVLNFKPLFHSF